MKNIIYLLFILFIFGCSKNKYNNTPNSTNNDSLLLYSTKITDKNIDDKIRKVYTDKFLNNSKNFSNSKNNIQLLIKISDFYYSNSEIQPLNLSSKLLLETSKKNNDSLIIGKAYNLRGRYNLEINNNDSAFYYFTKAEKIFFIYKDSANISKNYINKANVQLLENDFLGCEQSSFSALRYINENKEVKSLYTIYNFIGSTSDELKNYTNSLIYFNKALELSKRDELKTYNLTLGCKNNIGYVYMNMGEYKKAIESFKEGLKEDNLFSENPGLYAMLTDNYAYSKFKLKDYSELPSLFYISLKIREKNNLKQGIIINKIHLSEYYNEIKDQVNSKKYAYEALKLAKTTKISSDILASLKQLSNVDIKNAAKYSQEYIRLSDSVQNEERKAKDRFARIAYETDEVIQKNSELEVKNRNLVIFLFGAVSIFFLLYAVRTQKMRNRELAFKQEQQETNNQIYNIMISQQEKVNAASAFEKNRMAQELHDGILSKMFGTRMNLDSLNDSKDEASITMRYNYIQELKSIEQEIREISHDLSSVKGKIINNFVNIVIDLLEEQQKSFTSDLVYSIEKTISWEKLDNTAKINLYRILQESLQNCNKYANAKSITVTFTQIDESIVLKIEDDGDGFDLTKKKKGIGLKNMISRTEESKGKYEIISEQGKGTTTTVTFPLITQTQTQTT